MKYIIFISVLIVILTPCFLPIKQDFIGKADIIIVLAGGENEDRLKESLSYYKNNIPKSKLIIYTGGEFTHFKTEPRNSRRYYFENNGIAPSNIINISNVKNTMDEMMFLKNFMIKNRFNKTTIISDGYHAFRIYFIANHLLDYKKDGLEIDIKSIKYSEESIFKNIKYSLIESLKLYYNIIKYKLVL